MGLPSIFKPILKAIAEAREDSCAHATEQVALLERIYSAVEQSEIRSRKLEAYLSRNAPDYPEL